VGVVAAVVVEGGVARGRGVVVLGLVEGLAVWVSEDVSLRAEVGEGIPPKP
jgi:hypothetical protein